MCSSHYIIQLQGNTSKIYFQRQHFYDSKITIDCMHFKKAKRETVIIIITYMSHIASVKFISVVFTYHFYEMHTKM